MLHIYLDDQDDDIVAKENDSDIPEDSGDNFSDVDDNVEVKDEKVKVKQERVDPGVDPGTSKVKVEVKDERTDTKPQSDHKFRRKKIKVKGQPKVHGMTLRSRTSRQVNLVSINRSQQACLKILTDTVMKQGEQISSLREDLTAKDAKIKHLGTVVAQLTVS